MHLKDCKVYRLECNTCAQGLWSGWTDTAPDRRYSHDDLMEFQRTLTTEDTLGTRWRGRMLQEFGRQTIELHPTLPDDEAEPPFVHVHTTLQPGECLPPVGWDPMVHALCPTLDGEQP